MKEKRKAQKIRFQTRIVQLQNRNVHLEKRLAKKTEKLTRKKSENADLQTRISVLQNRETDRQTKISDLQSRNPDRQNQSDSDNDPTTGDGGRSEVTTFSFTVQNFSWLTERVVSPPTFIQTLPWKIMIVPNNTVNHNHSNSTVSHKSLGFYLVCAYDPDSESDPSTWSCQVTAELRILSRREENNFSRKISNVFSAKGNTCGFSQFLSWDSVVDPEKGFVDNDSVTFEVKVTADAPTGLLSDSAGDSGPEDQDAETSESKPEFGKISKKIQVLK